MSGSNGTRGLVALATYNERENLPTLVDAIQQAAPGADVLVVDDNSPDGTGDWCDGRAAEDPRFQCLHRAGKLGLGSATFAAFEWALERGYGAVVVMDADWSHPPEAIPALLALIDGGADVAVGSRYVAGGRIEGWPLARRLASRVMNRLTRLFLRLPVRDASGAFRAYRAEKLREIDFSSMRFTGYAYLEELLWRLHHRAARLAEAPITFRDRRAGASKVGLGEIAGKLRMLLWCATRRP